MINYINPELNSDYQRQCHFDGKYAVLNDYGTTITGEAFDFVRYRRLSIVKSERTEFSIVNIRLCGNYATNYLQLQRVKLHALAWGIDMDPERFHGTEDEKVALRHLLGYLKFIERYPDVVQKLNPGVSIEEVYSLKARSGDEPSRGILMPGLRFLSRRVLTMRNSPAALTINFTKERRNLSNLYGERFKFDPKTGEWTDLEQQPVAVSILETKDTPAQTTTTSTGANIDELGAPYIGDDGEVVLPTVSAVPPVPEVEPMSTSSSNQTPDLEALVELIKSEVAALAPNVAEITTKEEAWAARRSYGEALKRLKSAIEDESRDAVNRLNAKIISFDL